MFKSRFFNKSFLNFILGFFSIVAMGLGSIILINVVNEIVKDGQEANIQQIDE
jgi:hypothetical protein